MPQGNVEDGEEVLETAQRELYEETGLFLGVSQVLGGQFSYMIPGGGAKLQTWVHTRWCGDRANVRPKPGIQREFRTFEWITSDEVIDRCVWFKKDVYRAVLQRVLR
jgi:putative (di)nucleoside polyphosphate hydrolase